MSYKNKSNVSAPKLETKYDKEKKDKLEPHRVQKVVDALEIVKKHATDQELVEKASENLETLRNGEDPKKVVKVKKYICKRCGVVYNDKRQAQGHYNGDTMCDGEPRWTSDYNSLDEQFEIELGP